MMSNSNQCPVTGTDCVEPNVCFEPIVGFCIHDPDNWEDEPEEYEQTCTACHGTGIENGDIYDPDEPPCVVCWGTGTL